MSTASIAIIIPAYKPDFLNSALDSIKKQTSSDYHVYVADDGSPYDLKSIVEPYMEHMEISYHRFDTNLGSQDLVAHWTRAIALSDNEPYLWLFSDDDIMGEECVATFLSLEPTLRDNNLIHFNLNVIDSGSGIVTPATAYPQTMSAEEYLKAKLSGQLISYVVEFIFPRTIYENVGGFENFDLAWGSDFMTWIKMAAYSDIGIITINNGNSRVSWRKSDKNISPNTSHPIIKRKMQAFIENALFLKCFMKKCPGKFPTTRDSFRWLRFPLGEIFRKRHILSYSEILSLSYNYRKTVGHQTACLILTIFIILKKYL